MFAAFFSAMRRHVPEDARVMMCAFRGDPGDDDPGKWRARVLNDETQIDDLANIYLCVSAMRRNARGEFRRRKENFAGGLCLMIDDLGTGPGAKQPLSTIDKLQPTALIETSPDNYQAVYMFDRLETDELKFDALIRAFINGCLLTPANSGMEGVNRVFRPPAGVNGKKKYGGWTVRLASWHPEARYSIDHIAEAYGLTLERANPRKLNERWVKAHKPDRMRAFLYVRKTLLAAGMLKSDDVNMSGWQDVRCPWTEHHTGGADNGAAIREPEEENEYYGAFRCHHGHCLSKGWRELTDWIDHHDAEIIEAVNAAAPAAVQPSEGE